MSAPPVWAALAAIVVIIIAWLLRVISHRMIYKPVRFTQAPAPRFPADIKFEQAWFMSSDGIRLHGWVCQRPRNTTTLLICHGNTGSIEGREDTVQFYMDMGFNVFIFDYRGYGLSAGHPSETGTYRDVEAAWAYLRHTRGIEAGNIVLLGRSLGGAIAAHLAQREQPAAVILESTFTSLPDLATELYRWLRVLFSLNVRYRTVEKIGAVKSPLMIVHSTDDEVIGIHHATRLLEKAPPRTVFLEISGLHQDGFVTSRERYVPALVEFMRVNRIALGERKSTTL